MKFHALSLGFFTFSIILTLFSCASDSNGGGPVIDLKDVKSSSVAVIDVSGKNAMPTQYKVDGLLSSGTTQVIGSNKVASTYIPIEAGLRKISIGNYSDTIRVQESNYYTVMVYDNDSIRLSLDASYASNQFNYGPQVRWNMVGSNPGSYKVEIKSDTVVLRDVKVGMFVPASMDKPSVELSLYSRDGGEKLGTQVVPVRMNRNETINITKNQSTKGYNFEVLSQSTKP